MFHVPYLLIYLLLLVVDSDRVKVFVKNFEDNSDVDVEKMRTVIPQLLKEIYPELYGPRKGEVSKLQQTVVSEVME